MTFRMPLCQKFSYRTSTRATGGVDLLVTRIADGQSMPFFIAASTEFFIQKHMRSMTDDTCESLFPRARNAAGREGAPSTTLPS